MKNRVKALLLAAGLTIGMFGTYTYAQESEAEAVVSETETAPAEVVSPEEAMFEALKQSAGAAIESLPTMSEEALGELYDNDSLKALAANWDSVKDELGAVNGIGEQTAELGEDLKTVTVTTAVEYSDVPANSEVSVRMIYTFADKKFSSLSKMEGKWDIKYPKSKLFAEAGLNTLLGMGIVFIVLFFLSFLIGRIKIVNMIGKSKEKAAPAPAPAPVVAAPAVVEEDVTDDEELVAVIAAAIAAAEQTSTDGFVVRSIRKVNRR